MTTENNQNQTENQYWTALERAQQLRDELQAASDWSDIKGRLEAMMVALAPKTDR